MRLLIYFLSLVITFNFSLHVDADAPKAQLSPIAFISRYQPLLAVVTHYPKSLLTP
jgi:hypothetical protein